MQCDDKIFLSVLNECAPLKNILEQDVITRDIRKAIMKLHITSSEIFAQVFLLNQNHLTFKI